jgi:hypothetical protein
VVALIPIYSDDETNDFDFVQPLVAGWNGLENPCQVMLRPDGLYVDRYGKVGDAAAALRLFENANCRVRAQQIGKRYARYKVNLLTAALSTDADGQIYFTKHQ